MNYLVFGKTMENVQKHSDIRLLATKKRRKHLVAEANYHTIQFCTENVLNVEMKKNLNTHE